MRFGIFHTPFHLPNTQNPNLALRRDVEMVKLYDMLGFDEVWFGEHHSGGCELIVDPLTFIAHVAPQTQRIKLGTGVISLPYHNPLWIAERIIFVDHLTRGRADVRPRRRRAADRRAHDRHGPDRAAPRVRRGGRRADAPAPQRRADLDHDRSLHAPRRAQSMLKPYSDLQVLIAAVVSPSGPRIAGKHGLGLLSIAATMEGGADALAGHWEVVEQRSARVRRARPRAATRGRCSVRCTSPRRASRRSRTSATGSISGSTTCRTCPPRRSSRPPARPPTSASPGWSTRASV